MTFSLKPQRSRILVYLLGSIGDTIVAIPALKAIRRHFGSKHEIYLLHESKPTIKTSPVDLVAGSPEVDYFISYPFFLKHVRQFLPIFALWWKLFKKRFFAVIYLAPSQRTVRQVCRDAMFFRFCGIRQLIGFQAFSDAFLYPLDSKHRPGRVKHEALCHLDRLNKEGIDVSLERNVSRPFLKISDTNLEEAVRWLKYRRQHSRNYLVAVCPGTKQPANRWPIDRFMEIGKRLISRGIYELLIVGGDAEHSIGEKLVQEWGEGINACGHFSVIGSAALISQCAYILGLDTGTTHIAAVLGIPCIALYGARENPGRWEPLGEGHIILRKEVPCAGCRLIESPCPIPGHPCMTEISIDEVWQAVKSMEYRLIKKKALVFNTDH